MFSLNLALVRVLTPADGVDIFFFSKLHFALIVLSHSHKRH